MKFVAWLKKTCLTTAILQKELSICDHSYMYVADKRNSELYLKMAKVIKQYIKGNTRGHI